MRKEEMRKHQKLDKKPQKTTKKTGDKKEEL